MNLKNHNGKKRAKNEQIRLCSYIHVASYQFDYAQDDLFCLLSLNPGVWHYSLV
jgi:hypothetical protein